MRRVPPWLALLRRTGVACLALLPAASPAEDHGQWRHYGGDPGGRHYSDAAQINRDNVAQLEVAWVHRSGDSAGMRAPASDDEKMSSGLRRVPSHSRDEQTRSDVAVGALSW